MDTLIQELLAYLLLAHTHRFYAATAVGVFYIVAHIIALLPAKVSDKIPAWIMKVINLIAANYKTLKRERKMKLAALIVRIINAILYAINRKKKDDAANNAADAIANGGGVAGVDKSYSDMASKSRGDKTEWWRHMFSITRVSGETCWIQGRTRITIISSPVWPSFVAVFFLSLF